MDTKPFIEKARRSFGHVKGRTDIECLCLVISHLSHGIHERNAVWNENHNLRRQIEDLQKQLDQTI